MNQFKQLFLVLFFGSFCLSNAQNTVSFNATNPCINEEVTFVSTSQSSDLITELNWDLDNDGTFDDGTGVSVTSLFNISDSVTIGLQMITGVDDTVSAYQEVFIGVLPNPQFEIEQNCANQLTKFNITSTITVGSVVNSFLTYGDGSNSLLEETFFTIMLRQEIMM